MTGCLHNTCGYSKGQTGRLHTVQTVAIIIDEGETTCRSRAHACDNMQLPFMYFYKYIDEVYVCVSFTIISNTYEMRALSLLDFYCNLI